LDLQAITDVDAGRADLHAGKAIDAIAEGPGIAGGGRICRGQGHAGGEAGLAIATSGVGLQPSPMPARFAARHVVADDQGVAIEHRALEARIRAHVFAYLLAQVAGIAVGGEAIEKDPESFPAADRALHEVAAKLADWREEADESEAGPQREADPCQLLG